jgi:hypothetical protein
MWLCLSWSAFVVITNELVPLTILLTPRLKNGTFIGVTQEVLAGNMIYFLV